MRKISRVLLLMLVMVLVFGCSKESAPTSTDESDEKMVIITGINATNEAWVFDREPYGSADYRGELDAIYADDFTVAAGEAFFSGSSAASAYKDSDSFTETSSTTYELKVQFIAGGPAPTDEDEQYVYDPFAAVVDFVIKGTYGKPVTIEWDGTAFKQVE